MPEMDGGGAGLKNQAHEMTDTKANPAKTQTAADDLPPTEAQAGGALVAADTGSVVIEVSPKVEAEAEAAEAEAAEAEAAEAEAAAEVEAAEALATAALVALATAKAKAKAAAEAKANPNQAKVAAMLAKAGGAPVAAKTEPETKPGPLALKSNLASIAAAMMLAQICERAFMEHQLAACHFKFYSFCEHAPVPCVYVTCVCTPPGTALTAPPTESDRATRRGVLRPVELYHRRHVHLGVHRRRL